MVYCRTQRRRRMYLIENNYKSSLSTFRDMSWRSDLESEYDL